MTSELNPGTAFGSGIQTHSSGQSLHLLELLQRRIHLQTFADCDSSFSADLVDLEAVGVEIRE